MPYDLMKTSFFSEEWCKGSNPHTAATNHLWLDRSEATPVQRTCKSFPASCSLLLLVQPPCAHTALCVLQGQHCFAVLASPGLPSTVGRQPWCSSRLCPHTSLHPLIHTSPSLLTVSQALYFVEAALLNPSFWELWLPSCLLGRCSCNGWDCRAMAQERKLSHTSFGVYLFIYFVWIPFLSL